MVVSKSVNDIILGPALTEKSVKLAEAAKFVFYVHPGANKIEIKNAIESIYNAGKKKDKDKIKVLSVNVVSLTGKRRRTPGQWRVTGKRPDRKKAVITLEEGQILEGFGV
jgi:large subunit ribosomal protein L23